MRTVCMFAVDLTNGQLTPNNNTPLLAQALSVMNNYQAAAAGFGPPASPHAAGGRAGFPAASSPGPALDVYGSAADSVGYVQAASPQPSGFPAIAVSRAPLNYTPVSETIHLQLQVNQRAPEFLRFRIYLSDSKTFPNHNVIRFKAICKWQYEIINTQAN
ncbi:hypothetical protein HF086_009426 [Spodoptera exigua]|uniref:Uncharacterized protein n=1 Tax=Spodoptera exigua TaxID=7107 RepID=A0A922SI28_SPOEX|nr:hypothetical protein HF086_009426 [Spodoptera exigua]